MVGFSKKRSGWCISLKISEMHDHDHVNETGLNRKIGTNAEMHDDQRNETCNCKCGLVSEGAIPC